MDSTQIASLASIAEASKKPIIVHDLQAVCKQKILVNKITAEFLRTQIQLSENSKKLQDYSITNAKDKLALTNELIRLFEEQHKEFDECRQDECMEIYRQLNDLNTPNFETKKLIAELEKLDDKLKDLAIRIDYFEKRVPQEQEGTQYTIKKKVNLDKSCSYDITELD